LLAILFTGDLTTPLVGLCQQRTDSNVSATGPAPVYVGSYLDKAGKHNQSRSQLGDVVKSESFTKKEPEQVREQKTV